MYKVATETSAVKSSPPISISHSKSKRKNTFSIDSYNVGATSQSIPLCCLSTRSTRQRKDALKWVRYSSFFSIFFEFPSLFPLNDTAAAAFFRIWKLFRLCFWHSFFLLLIWLVWTFVCICAPRWMDDRGVRDFVQSLRATRFVYIYRAHSIYRSSTGLCQLLNFVVFVFKISCG